MNVLKAIALIAVLLSQAVFVWTMHEQHKDMQAALESWKNLKRANETGTFLKAPVTVTANIPPLSKEALEILRQAISASGRNSDAIKSIVEAAAAAPEMSGITIFSDEHRGATISGASIEVGTSQLTGEKP